MDIKFSGSDFDIDSYKLLINDTILNANDIKNNKLDLEELRAVIASVIYNMFCIDRNFIINNKKEDIDKYLKALKFIVSFINNRYNSIQSCNDNRNAVVAETNKIKSNISNMPIEGLKAIIDDLSEQMKIVKNELNNRL